MRRTLVRIGVAQSGGLDVPAGVGDTSAVDPLVVALAQLVRDRWAREQADRATTRERLQVVRRTDR